jgi:hypothetical protein
MEHDPKPKKHHRKCPAYKSGETYCECNNIYTPPTEPRYQKQRRLQWEKQWADKLKQKKK